jgi:hypothetical protein
MFAFLDVVMIESEKLKRKESDSNSWDYEVLSEFDFEKLEDAYAKAVEFLDSFRKQIPAK